VVGKASIDHAGKKKHRETQKKSNANLSFTDASHTYPAS
jgi:hypothetical protein